MTQTQFFQQFQAFTSGILVGFDYSNVVVIGGSVVGSLLPIPTNPPVVEEDEADEEEGDKKADRDKLAKNEAIEDNTLSSEEYYASLSPFKFSDIDLCLYGLSEAEFTQKLTQIYEHLKKIVGEREVKIYRTYANVIFSALYPFRHVQVSRAYVAIPI